MAGKTRSRSERACWLTCTAEVHKKPSSCSTRVSVQRTVSVAGRQAVIAPAVAPGGWRVIGQTPLTLLDVRREPLVPYTPGDIIRFRPISEDEFAEYVGQMMEAEQ